MLKLRIAAVALLAVFASHASAQTWNGTTDNLWGTASNWSTTVPVAAQTATFNNAGNANIAIDLAGTARPIGTILFDTATCAAYTFSGNAGDAFTFDAGGAITRNATVTNSQTFATPLQFLGAFTITNAGTTGSLTLNGGFSLATGGTAGLLTVTNAGAVTIGGTIAAGSITGLTKAGAGVLTLGAANLYTGTTTVNTGTLRFGSNNSLLPTSTLAVPASSTVDFQGFTQTLGNLTFNNAATATINFTGTAGSGLTLTNAATVLSPLNTTIALTMSMSTLGSFTYNNSAGTFNIHSGASTGAAATSTVTLSSTQNTITASVFHINNTTTSSTVPVMNVLLGTNNVINANTIRLGNARPSGNLRFATGLTSPILTIAGTAGGASTANLTIGFSHDSNTLATVPSDTVDTTLGTLNGNFGTILIANNIPTANSGRIIAMNGSFLTAAGTVNATTLNLGLLSNRATPTPANTIQSQITATYTLSNGGVHNIGTLNVATSAYTDTFTTNLPSSITATVNLNTGATLNATNILPGNIATATLAAGATFTVTRNFNWNDGTIGNIAGTNLTVSVPTIVSNGAAANHTFNISGSNTGTVSSIISGVGPLTKTGTGTLVLSGINTLSGGTTVNNGVLQLAGSGTFGAATIPLTLGGGTVDLNGLSRTVGVLSGASGTITNTAAATTSILTAGTAANATFSGNLTDGPGAGQIGLTKAGAGTLTLNGTNTSTGPVTVNAGTLNVATAFNTSTGLTLAPGATLSLTNGAGNHWSNLSTLGLAVGTGNSVMNLQLDTISTSDHFTTSGAASVGSATNTLTLNFTALGGFGVGLYPIFTAASGLDGGLVYSLGTTPPGFGYNLITAPGGTSVSLDVFTIVPTTGPIYWRGGTNGKWNQSASGNAVNFVTTNTVGATVMTGLPNSTNTVIFSNLEATSAVTTLETNFTINDLVFNNEVAQGTVASIAPGVVTGSTLTITPASSSAGITVQTGAPATITISAPVAVAAANQTWTVADALTSLTVSGGLTGSANITAAGSGSIFLNNAGTGYTGNITANNSAFSFGGTVATTISGVISGTAAIIKADTNTVTFGSINTYTGSTTLSGGRLDVLSLENGGVTSGIGASSNAATNLVFNGGTLTTAALANTTDRNITVDVGGGRIAATTAAAGITFNGAFTGSGTLIIGLSGTATSSTSNYALNADSSAGFTGGVTINNGNVTITNANNLGAGAKTITVQVNTTGNASLRLDGTGGDITLPNNFSFVTSLGNNPVSGIFNVAGNNTIAGSITLTSGYGGTLFSVLAGSLTLSGNITILTGQTSRAVLLGAGTGLVSGTLTDNGAGLLGVTKNADAGTWTVTGTTNTFTGNTTVLGGTLKPGNDNAFSIGSRLFFGDASASIGTFTTDGFNQQFSGLSAQSNNVNGASLVIGTGNTVTVTGSTAVNAVNIGSIASAVVSTTRLNVTGGGTLTVNDASRNLVVAQLITATGVNSPSIFDLSGLATFNATVTNVYVGRPTAAAGTAATTSSAEAAQLILAQSSTITASGDIVVGHVTFSSSATNTGTIRLGTANTIDANRLVFGGARASGTLNFQTGLTNPSVTLRGPAGGTSRIGVVVLGDQPNSTATGGGGGGSTTSNGTFDFSLGSVDAMIDSLTVGFGGGVTSSTRGKGNGTITINGASSVFDVNTLLMARNTSDTTATTLTNDTSSTALITLNNGSLIVNTLATMGNDQDVTGGGIQDLSATITVNGGSFTVGSTIAPVDLTMGNHTSTNPGLITATLNVNGGTVTVNGNILSGLTGNGTINSTVKLAGGTLDLAGHTIGSGSNPIANVTLQTGTLQNVLEINGGLVGVIKNTPGTLVLAGTNSYSGPTVVSNGTLRITGNNIAATGVVTVDGGTTGGILRGSGTVGGPVTVNGGTVPGQIRAGNSIGTLTLANGLTVNGGGQIFVEITGIAQSATLDSGGSTLGTLPNPSTNNFLNITGGFTTIDPGTVIVLDASAATFSPSTTYSYKIGQGAGPQSFSIANAGQFIITGGPVIDPTTVSFTGNSSGDLILNFTTVAVPEPALLGVLLLAGAALRRRK